MWGPGSRGDGWSDNRLKFYEEYTLATGVAWDTDHARRWDWANSLEWEAYTGFWPLRSWPTWVIGTWMGLKGTQQRLPGRRGNHMRYRLLAFFLHNGMNTKAARDVVLSHTVRDGRPVPGDYDQNATRDVDRMIEKFRKGELQYSVYDMLANRVVDHTRLL